MSEKMKEKKIPHVINVLKKLFNNLLICHDSYISIFPTATDYFEATHVYQAGNDIYIHRDINIII